MRSALNLYFHTHIFLTATLKILSYASTKFRDFRDFWSLSQSLVPTKNAKKCPQKMVSSGCCKKMQLNGEILIYFTPNQKIQKLSRASELDVGGEGGGSWGGSLFGTQK